MAAGTRELDERLDGWRHHHDLGLCRPAPPHRNDHDTTVGSEQAREMSGHRSLADALPGADDGDRGQVERRQLGRIEAEVRADVRDAEGEHAACERKSCDRIEDRLVGEVDDDVGSVQRDRRLDVCVERHTVVVAATQLLLPPTRTAATNSYGNSASASRTTGA